MPGNAQISKDTKDSKDIKSEAKTYIPPSNKQKEKQKEIVIVIDPQLFFIPHYKGCLEVNGLLNDWLPKMKENGAVFYLLARRAGQPSLFIKNAKGIEHIIKIEQALELATDSTRDLCRKIWGEFIPYADMYPTEPKGIVLPTPSRRILVISNDSAIVNYFKQRNVVVATMFAQSELHQITIPILKAHIKDEPVELWVDFDETLSLSYRIDVLRALNTNVSFEVNLAVLRVLQAFPGKKFLITQRDIINEKIDPVYRSVAGVLNYIRNKYGIAFDAKYFLGGTTKYKKQQAFAPKADQILAELTKRPKHERPTYLIFMDDNKNELSAAHSIRDKFLKLGIQLALVWVGGLQNIYTNDWFFNGIETNLNGDAAVVKMDIWKSLSEFPNFFKALPQLTKPSCLPDMQVQTSKHELTTVRHQITALRAEQYSLCAPAQSLKKSGFNRCLLFTPQEIEFNDFFMHLRQPARLAATNDAKELTAASTSTLPALKL